MAKLIFSILAVVFFFTALTWPQSPVCDESAVTVENYRGKTEMEKRLQEFFKCSPFGPPNAQNTPQTPCNVFAAMALSELYSIHDFDLRDAPYPYRTAQEIYEYALTSPNWVMIGRADSSEALKDAEEYSNRGTPIMAVKPASGGTLGHIAIVLPGALRHSGTWNLDVPNSASFFLDKPANAYVGKPLSCAFASPQGVYIFGRTFSGPGIDPELGKRLDRAIPKDPIMTRRLRASAASRSQNKSPDQQAVLSVFSAVSGIQHRNGDLTVADITTFANSGTVKADAKTQALSEVSHKADLGLTVMSMNSESAHADQRLGRQLLFDANTQLNSDAAAILLDSNTSASSVKAIGSALGVDLQSAPSKLIEGLPPEQRTLFAALSDSNDMNKEELIRNYTIASLDHGHLLEQLEASRADAVQIQGLLDGSQRDLNSTVHIAGALLSKAVPGVDVDRFVQTLDIVQNFQHQAVLFDLGKLGASGLLSNYVAAASVLSALSGGSQSDNAEVLGAIDRLSHQVEQLRREMNARFDVIEDKENQILSKLDQVLKESRDNQKVLTDQIHNVAMELDDFHSDWALLERQKAATGLNTNIGRARLLMDREAFKDDKTYSSQVFEVLNSFYEYSTSVAGYNVFSGVKSNISSQDLAATIGDKSRLDMLYGLTPAVSERVGAGVVWTDPVNPLEWQRGAGAYLETIVSIPEAKNKELPNQLGRLLQIGEKIQETTRRLTTKASVSTAVKEYQTNENWIVDLLTSSLADFQKEHGAIVLGLVPVLQLDDAGSSCGYCPGVYSGVGHMYRPRWDPYEKAKSLGLITEVEKVENPNQHVYQMFIMNITAGPNKGKALPYHIIRDNFTKTGSVWNTNSFVDALTFLDSIRNLLVEYEATEDFLNSDARAQLKVASRKLFDQFVDELPHRLSEKVKADGTGSIPKMDDKLRLDASILRYVESVRLLEDDQSVPWLLSEGPRVASISSLGSCLLYQAGGVQNGVSEPQATTHDVFEENYNSAAYLADIIPGAVHNELGKATEFTERASDQGSQSVVIDETLSKIRLLQARISDMAIP